jgi:cyanophycin synthetase
VIAVHELSNELADPSPDIVDDPLHGNVMIELFAAEANRRGIPIRRLRRLLLQLGTGKYQKRLWVTDTQHTSHIGAKIASRKTLTLQLLREVGLPVPDSTVVRDVDEAVRAASHIGYPVVLKPRSSNNCRGVCVNLPDDGAVRAYYPVAAREARSGAVIVERFIAGSDYRILVVNDQVVGVYERVPALVAGDGRSSVRTLIERANEDPRRAINARQARIAIDAQTVATLAQQGLDLDDIPQASRIIRLTPTTSAHAGAMNVDRTDDIHPDNVTIARLAARTLGLDVAGVDLITPDISKPAQATGGAINEVNSCVDIVSHEYPNDGLPRRVSRDIIAALFPPGQPVRVPVVAITGSTGTTTVAHMVDHLLRTTGRVVGLAATDGLYSDGLLLRCGSFHDATGARMVLNNPDIDAAVVETNAHDILMSGLGFSVCDVAVLSGIPDDAADIAQAIAAMLSTIHDEGAIVINADAGWLPERGDAPMSAMIIVSAVADNPIVADHVRSGGLAVILRDAPAGPTITILQADRETDLVPAHRIPALSNLQQPASVADVLATVAVGLAQDVPLDRINDALRTMMEHAPMAARPRLRADLSTYPLDDDLVVYDRRTGESYVLNATGRMVWERCDGTTTCQEIAIEIAALHGIPTEQARADVDELIDSFRRSNLLSTEYVSDNV